MRTGAARLNTSSPALYARLTGRALPLVVLARACGLAVLALLVAGRPKGIRVIAALGVAAVVWGWGVARYPVLLPGTTVTLTNAGAPQATMVAITVTFIVAVLLVGPSFALRFTLQSRRLLGAGEHGALTAAAPAGHSGQAAAARPRQPSPNGHPDPPPGPRRSA
jgi:cytochrome d ubiquinol oxidase subunit II